ncbi:MAG TPA: transketolase C-terminal domain-containing protein [Thermoplasmata archaeon]|nr:transketolase C-terminal domain-containing protein [Thermoplasmata archaeon]
MRDAYGKALLELGGRDPRLVVLDADLSGSTRTALFGKQYPQRFFNVGVMEQTMMAMAAGLSFTGRTAFASTFAVFAAGHAYNFVRQSICYNRANVKIVATHGGLLVGGDGGTHQMLEDIGLMRGLPGMNVIVPADAPTTRAVTFAVADHSGPAYVRLTRENLPTLTDGSFALGRSHEIRAGADLTLIAVGAMLARAMEVAEELHHVGVEARVLDFASIKPVDEKAALRAARETGAILTLEEHSVLTGLGAMVAGIVGENYPVPLRRLGVPDLFGESGDPWALLDRYGLSKGRALEEAWELLKMRGKVS